VEKETVDLNHNITRTVPWVKETEKCKGMRHWMRLVAFTV